MEGPTKILATTALVFGLSVSASKADGPFKGFFKYRGTVEQVNQKGGVHPKVKVDTSDVERSLRWNKNINDKLGPIGKLNIPWFNTKLQQNQRGFVPGYGWVDFTDQAQKQVDEYKKQLYSESSSKKKPTIAKTKAPRMGANIAIAGFLGHVQNSDWVAISTQVDSRPVVVHSVLGLVADRDSVGPDQQDALVEEARQFLGPDPCVHQMRELLLGITPGVSSAPVAQANGTKLAKFRYTDAGASGDGLIQFIDEGQTLTIIDIVLPSRHFTLREYVQFRLIAGLDELPLLKSAAGPGRQRQTADAQLMFALDPSDPVQFEERWAGLSDHARTWPICQFKRRQAQVRQQRKPLTDWDIKDAKAFGVRADSLQWIQATAPSPSSQLR